MFKIPTDNLPEMDEDVPSERHPRIKQDNNNQYQIDNNAMVYPNYMPNYSYGFPFDCMPHNRQHLRKMIDPLLLPTEIAFTAFMDTMGRVTTKQR